MSWDSINFTSKLVRTAKECENPTIDLAIEYIEVYDRAHGVQNHVSELCWVKELKQPQIAEITSFQGLF